MGDAARARNSVPLRSVKTDYSCVSQHGSRVEFTVRGDSIEKVFHERVRIRRFNYLIEWGIER